MVQIALIFSLCFLGQVISAYLPFPFPSSVIAMILLLIFLIFKFIKEEAISGITNFLLDNLPIFFVPPCVSIMDNLSYFDGILLQFIFICIITTVITFFVTANTVKYVIKLQNREENKHA